ncbi:hypothetical protein [Nocardioides sp. CER19]|uniref:hypothetical protein n=1 Tax=Nocardioides sp. CER19 TaxID=3038538 RepID=UPI00244D19B5|nr:hypothetical protein [Nocardioides sp. CER19]MDH2413942.1 hypothetical protein [Nocardioides sp. CER19]
MVDLSESCSCCEARTDDGTVVKMGWLRLHDSVRVGLRDGSSVAGWTYGLEWRRSGALESLALTVETTRGWISVVEARDIETISPLSGTTDASVLLQDVQDIVSRADALEESENHDLQLIMDAHTTLEIAIRKRRHPCSPRRCAR